MTGVPPQTESSPHSGEAVLLCHPAIRGAKRLVDLIVVLLVLPVLVPLCLLIVLCVWVEDGGRAVYVQTRVGRRGRHFPCLKFRSMSEDAEIILTRWRHDHPDLFCQYQDGPFKLRDDPRVTRVGRLLRAYSLDELPQLLNVLAGQMTLIGPRPILPREQEEYGPGIHLYSRVTPGLTGLWQVSGRSDLSFRERVDLDDRYIRQWSPGLDVKILIRTFAVVFGRRGAY